jgi:hypothetical protein
MKKPFAALLLAVLVVFSLGAQVPPQAQQPKPEDILKNLVLVEKPQPVPEALKAGFESITAKDSLALLSFISSDLLEGRETATRGYQLAAEYAASLFTLWKLKPAGDMPAPSFGRGMGMAAPGAERRAPERSFLQEFALREVTESSSRIVLEVRKGDALKTRAFTGGVDYQSMSMTGESVAAPVVFAGYGIQEKEIGWDDFKNLDLKGKIVLVLSEAPGKDDPKSPFQKKELKEKYFPAGGGGMMMRRMGDGFNKTREIAKLGPAAILQVQNSAKDADLFKSLSQGRRPSDDRPINTRARRRLMIPGTAGNMPWESSPVITITREMANAVLEGAGVTIDDLKAKIETAYKPASMPIPATKLTVETTTKTALVRGANVLGVVEGSDPKLKDEVVVIGAHYDHLGAFDPYVYNGADDNGSGSVGVLNAARAMALNPQKPKRTVVFALWTGEEQGLLGSRFYVQNPPFPIAGTVAYFNMDMISRPYTEQTMGRMRMMFNIPGGDEILKKVKPANFLPVSFSASAGLGDVLRAANQYVGLDVFLRESSGQERGGGGSDHSSFGAVKVPWVFTIAAMTDDYHQTSDSVEKVSGELIEKISRLVYAAAYALADK